MRKIAIIVGVVVAVIILAAVVFVATINPMTTVERFKQGSSSN